MDAQCGQQAVTMATDHGRYWIALIGAAGGIIGTILTLLSNYWIARRDKSDASILANLRKEKLREMLENRGPKPGRSLATLMRVTGTSKAECRSLLVSIGARGFTLPDGREGWTFSAARPLQPQTGP